MSTVRTSEAAGVADTSTAPASGPSPHPVAVVAVAGVVAAGVALRLWTRSDLWLDEALSVNIARLPVGDLLDALRHDGHPPLYYLLLHGWIEVVGAGDTAVRLLSGVLSVASLPLAWSAGRRLGGRRGGTVALLLLATSPFAVRYATEARMYSLVVLLVLAGWLLVRHAVEHPSLPRLAAVSVVAGLLLLTHYWSFHLLAVTVAAVLGLRGRRGAAAGSPHARAAVAVAAGGLLFVPWMPAFLDQASSTGTPWAAAARPADVVMRTVSGFGGGTYAEGLLLGTLLAGLVALGVLGRTSGRHHVELDLRTRPRARPDGVVVAGTLALGALAGYATASAFEPRYTAVILPSFLLLATLGVVALPARAAGIALVAVVALGLAGGVRNAVVQRTQGGEIGRAIAARATDGDVVAFCPDQLGPAVSRAMPGSVTGVRFPDEGDPRFVDWVDYRDRIAERAPADFAEAVHRRAGSGTVWLVWMGGYRGFDHRCEAVARQLASLRPGEEVVVAAGDHFESAWLHRYPAP